MDGRRLVDSRRSNAIGFSSFVYLFCDLERITGVFRKIVYNDGGPELLEFFAMFANFSRAFVICAVSALAAGGLTVSSAVAAERSNGETGVLVDSLLYQVRDTLIRVREGTNDGLRLTNARLSLSTVYRQEAGGKLSLWVVSAGGSVEEASTQSLVMNLRPPASGDDIPVADVGDALAQAIIEAHGAVASAELSDPPLRLDSIESTLKFIVELDGTAGAGFKILPLTVDVSGGVSSVKTHEIHLKFCSSEC